MVNAFITRLATTPTKNVDNDQHVDHNILIEGKPKKGRQGSIN